MWDSRVYGGNRGTPVSTGEVNTLEPAQLFVGVTLPGALGKGSKIDLQAGRFLLALGSRRLVAAAVLVPGPAVPGRAGLARLADAQGQAAWLGPSAEPGWATRAGRARLAGPGRPRLASPTPKPLKNIWLF